MSTGSTNSTTKLKSRHDSGLLLPEKRILIVDDELIICRAIEIHLKNGGFPQIRSITDSRQAIETIREFQPDMLLLDIFMPHNSGLDLLQQICENHEFDSIICLMVSSAGEDEECRALEIGALGFIPKPVVGEELIRIVATTFRIANHFGTR